ncbi:hypothetical protein HWV62_5177 [Athelia sp. TMB]|nr:hypothetical protein HWV62_5177 [Athelia sp. TMB]
MPVFVLDLARNGEMQSHISTLGSLSTACTHYYSAPIVDALEYMHTKGAIHSPRTYCWTTTSKLLGPGVETAETFVGTSQYVSPELLEANETSKSSNLWALGCIIYQMMAGCFTFTGLSDCLTRQKIKRVDYSFPDGFDEEAKDLIQKLILAMFDFVKEVNCYIIMKSGQSPLRVPLPTRPPLWPLVATASALATHPQHNLTMTKPKRETAAAKAQTKAPRKVKPIIERTIVTRAANANRNPNDLEVVSSEDEEEEYPVRKTVKRKKKIVKTQEELDAEEELRNAALATVSHLEVDMERQAKIHDGTPRTSSAVSISRRSSYVVPDPPARSQPKPRSNVILSTTEESEDILPPAKRTKAVVCMEDVDVDEDTDIALGNTEVASKPKSAARVKVATDKAKQSDTKKRVVEFQEDYPDVQMDLDSSDKEEESLSTGKAKSAAHVKVGAGRPTAKRRATKSNKNELNAQMDVDVDSDDDEKVAPLAKKPRPIRAVIDKIKADRLQDEAYNTAAKQDDTSCPDSDDNSPSVQKSSHITEREQKTSKGLPRAQAQKKTAPIQDLFERSATSRVKKEKVIAQEEPVLDSEVEIVAENLKSKPSVILKGKSQSKPKLKAVPHSDPNIKDQKRTKAVKHDRDSYRQADEDEDDQGTAFIEDWAGQVINSPKRKRGPGTSRNSKATTPTLTSGTSKHSKASKAPSSSRTALNNKVKIKDFDHDDSDTDNDNGLISDRDERYSGERALAANSPHKGKGKRATSSSLVKITESRSEWRLAAPSNASRPIGGSTTMVTIKSEKPGSSVSISDKKASTKITNKDLPVLYLEHGAWRIVVMTTIRYIATTDEVFNVKDGTMVRVLTIVTSVIYGPAGIDLVPITPSSAPFRLTHQRLADAWRTILGSAAIAALTAFFDSNSKFNSDKRRRKFALNLYEKQRYLFQTAEGDNKKRFKGLFHGSFVIQTFAAHLNVISGSQEVLELYADAGVTHKDQIPRARGALALCAAAVMRAVALYATDGSTLSSLKDAKGVANNRLSFPSIILPISDTEIRDKTKRSSAFSAMSWEEPTAYFFKACKTLSDENMDSIIKEAKEYSRASRRHAREIDSDFDPDNSLLQLGNESTASEDEQVPPAPSASRYSGLTDSNIEAQDDFTGDEDMVNESGAEEESDESDQ